MQQEDAGESVACAMKNSIDILLQRQNSDRVEFYESAIRKHHDYRGDDRCWMDDEELYKTLPEGYTPPKRDTCVELHNCNKYIACRQNPATTYVSPEREIERLQAEVKRLEALTSSGF